MLSRVCSIRTGITEHHGSDSAAVQFLLRMAAHQQSDVTSCGLTAEWVLGVAGSRDAGTSGAEAVPLRSAQMMGPKKKVWLIKPMVRLHPSDDNRKKGRNWKCCKNQIRQVVQKSVRFSDHDYEGLPQVRGPWPVSCPVTEKKTWDLWKWNVASSSSLIILMHQIPPVNLIKWLC